MVQNIGIGITEVFSLLPKLKHLDLSGNPVNSWSPHTFMGLSQIITKIDLSNVGLFSLPRLRSSSLEYLNLSNNFIYEIDPKEIEIFPSLLTLDLSGNRIVEINAQIFEKMPELKVLNISDNGNNSGIFNYDISDFDFQILIFFNSGF
uniref:Uncharacterized protein n=1 Tax=Meloidogyne incognita TaxID=6306 RepID=A0A914KT63_MELIC